MTHDPLQEWSPTSEAIVGELSITSYVEQANVASGHLLSSPDNG
jgi:hypothetical protein